MPHLRKRYLAEALRKAVSFSPIVGVLGHRQVGKTTLIHSYCNSYASLDQKKEQLSAIEDPIAYLDRQGRAPVGLDECQWVPEIFPALKERVRIHKKPGQFILSGSIRFTSKRAIRESLTGRIVYLELTPFVLGELSQDPPSGLLAQCLEAVDFSGFPIPTELKKSEYESRSRALDTYTERGGLPGICMVRDALIRRQKFEDQFETLLERDLKQLVSTPIEFRRLILLCRSLAESQGEPIDWTLISRKTRISTPTLKKLLQALESLFLIRTVPIEGGKKGFVVWFEDQGESHYLTLGRQTGRQKLAHLSAIHARTLLSCLMKYSLDYFQYRTRGGALIPFCIRSERGVLGIMLSDSEEEMSRSEIAQAKSFLNTYAQAKIISVHSGRKSRLHSSRILSVPATQLFW